MRASIISAYGSPDVLTVEDIPAPTPGPRELLVEVHASPVTEGDRRMRTSDFPGVTWLPGRLMMGALRPKHRVPGTIFAGRVIAVGGEVTRFGVGDKIFGLSMHGAYAERLIVPEEGPHALMPRDATYAEAAALPYGAGTALTFMKEMARVKEGERVLVLGASGGVGRFAVQIAKHLGAHVTGVCSAANADIARAAGADEVLDYRTTDFRATGERYDVIFDTAMATTFSEAQRSLAPTGRYLTLLMSVTIVLQMLFTSIFGKKKALFGISAGGQEGAREVASLWESGAISPLVDRTFPLDRVADAHGYQASGPRRGAVIVELVPGSLLKAVA